MQDLPQRTGAAEQRAHRPESAAPAEATLPHDVFISYSRKDAAFADAFERALERYTPPKGLRAERRPMRVFRDQSDMTGVEYHQSIQRHLTDSRKLVVLCSPHARASRYVNEEIRIYAESRGAHDIIPLLVGGVPNNEAAAEREAEKAFPQSLCEAMQLPLAADFRNFDVRRDRLNKGSYYGAWYTTLANLLDCSRSDIEQRDRKRNARLRNITIGIVSGIIAVLAVAFVVTLLAQREAVKQRDQAEHRRLTALTQLVASRASEQAAEGQELWSKLLARQAYLFNERINGEALAQVDAALRVIAKDSSTSLELHADENVESTAVNHQRTRLAAGGAKDIHLWNLANPDADPLTLAGHAVNVVGLAFSPDGNTLASASWDETVRIWSLSTDPPTSRALRGHVAYVWAVAFRPDGNALASASDDGTVREWDLAALDAEPRVLRVPVGGVRSLAYSDDGALLAAGTTDRGVTVWERGEHARSLMGEIAGVEALAFSRDNRKLAVAAARAVAVWDLVGSAAEPQSLTLDDDVSGVAFSPDGSLLAVALLQQDVLLYQLSNLAATPVLLARPLGTDALTYENAGSQLVAIGRTATSGSRRLLLQTWRMPTATLAEEMCGTGVASNLPARAWERLVGSDVPYERTCARHEVHPDYYGWIENLATDGDTERALAAYRRADELDHPGDKPVDRAPEVNRWSAKGVVVRADALARAGDLDGAMAGYRRALTLDPGLGVVPESTAKAVRAQQVVLEADARAREGDFEDAVALLREANRLDPALAIDAEQRAADYASYGLVNKGVRLSANGEIGEALAAVARGRELRPDMEIGVDAWFALCRNGGLWDHSADVLFACDRAVELDDDPRSVGSRGIARALAGNREGALEDLREFVEASSLWQIPDVQVTRATGWVAALERGEDPITADVLAELREEL